MTPSLFYNVAGLGSSNTDVQVVKERVRGGLLEIGIIDL